MTRSWGIVGGGVLGLTLALRLSESGEHVTIVTEDPDADVVVILDRVLLNDVVINAQ